MLKQNNIIYSHFHIHCQTKLSNRERYLWISELRYRQNPRVDTTASLDTGKAGSSYYTDHYGPAWFVEHLMIRSQENDKSSVSKGSVFTRRDKM